MERLVVSSPTCVALEPFHPRAFLDPSTSSIVPFRADENAAPILLDGKGEVKRSGA